MPVLRRTSLIIVWAPFDVKGPDRSRLRPRGPSDEHWLLQLVDLDNIIGIVAGDWLVEPRQERLLLRDRGCTSIQGLREEVPVQREDHIFLVEHLLNWMLHARR